MSITTINTRVQFRRDTQENWLSSNPVLADGELGIVKDDVGYINLKLGNGVSSFSQLPFLS